MDSSAPDAPVSTREEDVLRRWNLAQTVYDLIQNSHHDWSLRIGIYGGWGEGKTSVLRFIETMARVDHVPVIWFNPWRATDRTDLWTSFCSTIEDALGYRLPRSARIRRLLAESTAFIGPLVSAPPAELSGGAATVAKALLVAAAPLIRQAAVPKLAHVQRQLRNLPPETRLIVMIDDVDRAEPELTPHLLLALREVFDLPCCAFLVALDPSTVAPALRTTHPGWGSGPQFLEKIIQFPFWLPSPHPDDLANLATKQLARLPSPPDPHAIQELADLLPQNPRKLKEFFGRLQRLTPVLTRHDPDEIRWQVLILIELMRSVAPTAAERLFRSVSFKDKLTTSIFVGPRTTGGKDDYGQKALDELREDATSLLRELKCDDDTTKALVRLIEAFRDRTPLLPDPKANLEYLVHLDDAPPIFTWKEFRDFLWRWSENPTPQRVTELVVAHVTKISTPLDAAYRELFETVVNHRQVVLSNVADQSLTIDELARELEAANLALSLIKVFVKDLRGFSSETSILKKSQFKVLYDHIGYWAHFTNLPQYVAARAEEREILLLAAEDGAAFASDLLAGFSIWNPFHSGPYAGQRVLYDDVVAVLVEHVFKHLRDRFDRKDGIGSLWGRDHHLVEKYLLFRGESGFYSPELRAHLQDLAKRAKTDQAIQENFLEFLRLLTFGLTKGLNPLDLQDSTSLASDPELVSLAWTAATAVRVQPRVAGDLRGIRRTLARYSGEANLPLPRWWEPESEGDQGQPRWES